MNTVKIDTRITKIQNRLFEQAHTHPLELKPLAIAMSKQGINGEKLYSHPGNTSFTDAILWVFTFF